MADKRYGLRLTLGGAPNTPHLVPGLPGYFRPDVPTPVGGDGELTLEAAREVSKSNSPVELVELKPKEADEAKELYDLTVKEARSHRHVTPEPSKSDDERAALKEA